MKKSLVGFTLIEVILSVSLLFIGGFSLVFSSNFLLQNAAANTRDQFLGELRKAQIYALGGRENSAWGVQYSSNTITLFKGNSYASRDSAFDEVYESNENIQVTGLTEVVFSRMTGLPNTTGTITISGTSVTKTVTVGDHGVISQ